MPDFRQALGSHLGWVKRQVFQIDRSIQPHIQRVPRISPGVRAAEASLTNDVYLRPSFRITGAKPLLPLYAFMASTTTNLPSPPDKCRDGTLHRAGHLPSRLPYLLFTNQKIWSNTMSPTDSTVRQSVRYGVGESTTQLTIGVGIIYARRRHVSVLVMGHLQVLTNVLRVLYSVCYKLGTLRWPRTRSRCGTWVLVAST
jgi:hypothetical protein